MNAAVHEPVWPYPHVVAHRGGGAFAPENTSAALDAGARYGLRMVEFDAKLSADGVPFLLHDDCVDRTSNGCGAAARLRYDEIAALDAGSWFAARFAGERMPTLDVAAARCIALGLAANVEIKPCPGRDDDTGRIVAAAARGAWSAAHPAPLFSSFSYAALAAARDVAPDCPRGLLFERVPDDWAVQCRSLGCLSLHADHRALDRSLVRRIKDAGLCLLAYTVDRPERAAQLAEWGVDAICTDRIDLIGADFPWPPVP